MASTDISVISPEPPLLDREVPPDREIGQVENHVRGT